MEAWHEFVAVETLQAFLVGKYHTCTAFDMSDIDRCD